MAKRAYETVVRGGYDMNNKDIKFMTRRKVYYCISCAKHKGIFEMKKERAIRAAANRLQL